MSRPATTPPRKSAAKTAKPAAAARKRSVPTPAKAAPGKPVRAAAGPVAGRAPETAAAVPAPAGKPALKLVRDGFTMPQADFDLIAVLKQRAVRLQRPAKKSELLRAGLHVLQALPDEALLAALGALVQVKQGRPKKAH